MRTHLDLGGGGGGELKPTTNSRTIPLLRAIRLLASRRRLARLLGNIDVNSNAEDVAEQIGPVCQPIPSLGLLTSM